MSKRLYGFRGAICTENTKSEIQKNVCLMFEQIMSLNNITQNDMVSIQFSVTPDLTALNPATALRMSGFAEKVPLFCSAEPVFDGSLKQVIRILILAYAKKNPIGVYLNGAQVLRSDIYAEH